MAQGAIVWRCRRCGNKSHGTCQCRFAKYYIVYLFGQKQKWEAVSRSKREAENRLAERMGEIQGGTYREIKKQIFKEFSAQWLRDYVSSRVKPSTLRSYTGLVEKHLDPFFGNFLLNRIEPQHIQSFIAETIREKKLSPRTVNYLVMVLKMMFKQAKLWRLLRENPAENISRVRQEQQEMDFLSPEEIRLLLQHSDEPFRTLFLVAILTGMRRGELLALQWGDINWPSNVIHVKRSLFWYINDEVEEERRWIFSSPKSRKSIRTVVMSPKLREALQIHRINGAVNPHDLVFCTKRGTPLDPDNMIKQQFHPALDRAELRRIRFHDLRHTYTALLIAQGAHAKFIQSQLGHASIQTTLDRYGHLMPETHVGVGEQLDHQIFSKSDNEKVTA